LLLKGESWKARKAASAGSDQGCNQHTCRKNVTGEEAGSRQTRHASRGTDEAPRKFESKGAGGIDNMSSPPIEK